MHSVGVISFLALVALTAAATDKNITEGDIDVRILGQSGKIMFGRKKNSVTVNFDYIKELDKDDNAVGSTGKKKHSINTFARENFTFPTSGLKSHYQNLSVKHTQFEATISGPGAKLIVDIYIFKEAGNVSTSENETLEVKQGTIKFNIKLENWTFCGAGDNCKKGQKAENGSQVEFGIEIKGRGNPKKKSKAKGKGRKVETLDLGGADCTLSGAVNVDGVWKEMSSDYPKVETQGVKNLFIFRFPKFSSSVSYDPAIDMSSASSNQSVANNTTPKPSSSSVAPTTRPAGDKNVTDGDIKVNIRGQSGKITFSRKNNSVTVNFDYIKELDNAGTAVGTTGSSKHSINTFARESFTFATSGLKSNYQNISVKHTQFAATISGPGAKLTVDIYIFKGSGSVSTSKNETLEVKPGTIKFNIKLESWTFCGAGDNCKKGQKVENGSQVEFGIEIKGRGNPKKKSKAKGKGRKVETLDLGGADCTLSGAVNVDGSWVEMASDYPKVDTTGPKTLFIFRFPKFTKDVLYDPTIELSDDGSSVSPTTQPGPSSTVKPNDSGANLRIEALPILMFLAALLKIFC